MKTTKFSCVEMKHRGANKIIEKTKLMTKEQEIKFWNEKSLNLRKYQSSIKQPGIVPIPVSDE